MLNWQLFKAMKVLYVGLAYIEGNRCCLFMKRYMFDFCKKYLKQNGFQMHQFPYFLRKKKRMKLFSYDHCQIN